MLFAALLFAVSASPGVYRKASLDFSLSNGQRPLALGDGGE